MASNMGNGTKQGDDPKVPTKFKCLPDHDQSRIRVETLHKLNSETHACPHWGRGASRKVHVQSWSKPKGRRHFMRGIIEMHLTDKCPTNIAECEADDIVANNFTK